MKQYHSIEWNKVFEVLFVFLIINTFIFYLISFRSMSVLWFGYYSTITLYSIQAMLMVVYALSALPHRNFEVEKLNEEIIVPKTTFIVSAYLTNEVTVIEETLLNILEKVEWPAAGIEVILVYNTPHLDPVEIKLRELALKWPELILSNAYKSRSKSENLNYVISQVSGEMVVLLDADHLVAPDCLKRAWRWLAKRYDVVQGRCQIRNGGTSLVTRLVEVEFEIIYGIQHFTKSMVYNAALFGGSNGYWKKSVLQQIKFRTDMLTEDIDATLRATLSGYHFFHDRSIIASELAPETPGRLWFQRKRWAQGWFQTSLKYQWPILWTKYLNLPQKFLWTTLLMWRIFYDLMTHFLFPIVFAFWLHQGHVSFPMSPYIWYCVLITLLSGPFETIIAYADAVRPHSSVWRYAFYALCTFPYTLFKNTLQVVAMRDELLGKRDWVISPRGKR